MHSPQPHSGPVDYPQCHKGPRKRRDPLAAWKPQATDNQLAQKAFQVQEWYNIRWNKNICAYVAPKCSRSANIPFECTRTHHIYRIFCITMIGCRLRFLALTASSKLNSTPNNQNPLAGQRSDQTEKRLSLLYAHGETKTAQHLRVKSLLLAETRMLLLSKALKLKGSSNN